MGSYDGWSLEQLKAAIFSTDPGSLSSSASSWSDAAERTADLGTDLAKKVAEVAQGWKGMAADAFGEYMGVIQKFTAELGADQADMGEGLTKMSMHSSSAKERATIALTPQPKTKEEKEKARKQLAIILADLAGDDRRSATSYWKAPAKAPKELPASGEVAPERIAPVEPVATAPGTLDGGGAQPHVPPAEPVPYAPPPVAGDGYGYDNGSTGLAGVGSGTLSPVGSGAGLGSVGIAGALGTAGAGAGMAPGTAMTGLTAGPAGAPLGGGVAGGAAGAGRVGAGAGLFPRGRGEQDEDPDGTRTWLTEDDLEWTGEETAPDAVVGRG